MSSLRTEELPIRKGVLRHLNKTAWYDFDSEQYRSPIRKNTVKGQGIRGEMIDDRIYYLDKNNKGQADQIITGFHITRTDNPNPNLSEIYEVEKIS